MDAVRKAASEAVQAVRNSPLLRRRFGTQDQQPPTSPDHPAISPQKDRTPFVQGFYYRVQYLGKTPVDPAVAQDHGCTDSAVELLWDCSSKTVSIKVTTTSIRIKLCDGSDEVLYDIPVFRVSYCAPDKHHKEAVSFVAKDQDNCFYCYVFMASSQDKAYALALSISKAFYLAYQIVQEQQGIFPPTPERERLFEPQHTDDTAATPPRPNIPTTPPLHREQYQLTTTQTHTPVEEEKGEDVDLPHVRVCRPSTSTADSLSLGSNIDEDFVRLAKARSNPDILRSTLDMEEVKHPSLTLVQLHADPSSHAGTPSGSTDNLLVDS